MSEPRKTDTLILAGAMDILARDIQSEDGVANAAIQEAGDRLRELEAMRKADLLKAKKIFENVIAHIDRLGALEQIKLGELRAELEKNVENINAKC